MNAQDILKELSKLGTAQRKKVLLRHGAKEPFFGVKIEDMKKFLKRIPRDHTLALRLFDTGNGDAMYLAGFLCDPSQMRKSDLRKWVRAANWYMLSEYMVAWTAAESRFGRELALEWINAKKENIASSGWATLSSLVSITKDEALDMTKLKKLLARAAKEIPSAPNRVRYAMNNFIISVGTYVAPLAADAARAAREVGTVTVDMGGTACKVPNALDYIEKVRRMGKTGKKRKAFC